MATKTIAPSAPPSASRTSRRDRAERRLAFRMTAPSLILMALVAAVPIGYAIWLSLNQYSVRTAGLSRFVGLDNYIAALTSQEWWAAFGQTFTFAAFSVWRRTRNSSVSRPFSSTQELNGLIAGPVWRSMSL